MGVTRVVPAVSLGEGSTPLVPAPRLSRELGLRVHLKCEGLNPTGSFKDRGMAVAVSRAAEAGAHAVVCASTGNTAASAAAYAARAGLRAVVLTPQGATAGAKRAQARAAGATVLEVRGTFDDALRCCRELAGEEGFTLVNSLNPDRLEGQKTVAFEVLAALGRAPDVVALPFGGGGNLRAVARGFEEAGEATRLVAGEAVARATTWASAIRIREPAHAAEVADLVESGRAEVVSLEEDEIRIAWLDLARLEGMFCEPASAASLAALRRVAPPEDGVAVCILTGHGLKDVSAVVVDDAPVVEPRLDAILEALS
jgi:threonine synthase